jgi:hypothetical protein
VAGSVLRPEESGTGLCGLSRGESPRAEIPPPAENKTKNNKSHRRIIYLSHLTQQVRLEICQETEELSNGLQNAPLYDPMLSLKDSRNISI